MPSRSNRHLVGFLVIALGVAPVGRLGVSPAGAAGTDPTLAIQSAAAIRVANGAVAVSVSAISSFDDLMQFSFPAGLIIFQGTHFARFQFAGGIADGNDPSVQDGITDVEIPALLNAGAAAPAPAALSLLRRERIDVTLPPGFTAGTASAVIYAILEGDAFVSNTVSFAIP